MCFFNDNFFNFQQFFSPIGYGPLFQIVHVASSTQVAAGMYLHTSQILKFSLPALHKQTHKPLYINLSSLSSQVE